ncbi:MAG: hypothetical protein RSG50_05015 [Clostridia bacterium]
MNDTVLAALIGGLVASIPNLTAVIVDLVKSRRQQRHDEKLRYFDMYAAPRFKAIENYARILTDHVSCLYDNSGDIEKLYIDAYEQACLFVSEDTRELMNASHGVLIPVMGGGIVPRYGDSRQALRSPEYNALLAALRRELTTSIGSEEQPKRQNQKNHSKCHLQAIADKASKWIAVNRLRKGTDDLRDHKTEDEANKSSKKSPEV